jgi:hypothetical protein
MNLTAAPKFNQPAIGQIAPPPLRTPPARSQVAPGTQGHGQGQGQGSRVSYVSEDIHSAAGTWDDDIGLISDED